MASDSTDFEGVTARNEAYQGLLKNRAGNEHLLTFQGWGIRMYLIPGWCFLTWSVHKVYPFYFEHRHISLLYSLILIYLTSCHSTTNPVLQRSLRQRLVCAKRHADLQQPYQAEAHSDYSCGWAGDRFVNPVYFTCNLDVLLCRLIGSSSIGTLN